ncbi:MAG: hypothetical protein ABI599_11325 [Flavobacteriales bacterium]
MDALDLSRRLRRLRRAVDMLQADLRQRYVNEQLLGEIEKQMEHGIATDARCTGLRTHVDTLRENTLTPRPELLVDTARACEQLKFAIDGVVNVLH